MLGFEQTLNIIDVYEKRHKLKTRLFPAFACASSRTGALVQLRELHDLLHDVAVHVAHRGGQPGVGVAGQCKPLAEAYMTAHRKRQALLAIPTVVAHDGREMGEQDVSVSVIITYVGVDFDAVGVDYLGLMK